MAHYTQRKAERQARLWHADLWQARTISVRYRWVVRHPVPLALRFAFVGLAALTGGFVVGFAMAVLYWLAGGSI